MTETFRTIVALIGMPRSGTSWLGQLFDSSPEVAYRLEPIFSYAFKNVVDEHSTKEEYNQFFEGIYRSQDDFMLQTDKRIAGTYPVFIKNDFQPFLVFKTTRFHNLLDPMLSYLENLKMVCIVRHPCGSICSWLNTPREFPTAADPKTEWRSGACRKTANEEFWGFNDWKVVTLKHLELHKKYPDRFKIIKYEDLVGDTSKVIADLYDFAGLTMSKQTYEFIKSCHLRHDDDSYSVFKDKKVVNNWRGILDASIVSTILNELKGTTLEQFTIDKSEPI
ncbi:MAG: sulfotransferase [Geobacteraceae bacterium]|nr:sulfotransferase [Geobacteraceae bacterium]